MKKNLYFLLFIFTVTCVFAADFPFIGKANSDKINLRAGPNTNYEIITKIKKDAELTVISERFDWYKVMLSNGSCFISKKYVEIQPLDTAKAIVTGNNVNLRAQASDTASILGKAGIGTEVKILKTYPEWYEISAPQGMAFGWVHKKFVDYKQPFLTTAKAEETKPESAKQDLPPPKPIAIGVVRPSGIFLKRRGTHKLIVNGKPAYYLKGDKKTLDKFTGLRVNIFGEITGSADAKIPLIEVKQIGIAQ